MGKIKPSIIIAIFAVIVFAGGYFTTIKNTKEKIETRREEYQKLQTKLKKTRAVVKRKEEANRKLRLVSQKWKQAKRMLPEDSSIPGLLKTVTKLASSAEVKIDHFKPGSKNTKDKYIEIPIAMTITGSYHNVVRFIAGINNMERIINIRGIELGDSKGEGTKEFVIKAEFTAVAYVSKGITEGGEKSEK